MATPPFKLAFFGDAGTEVVQGTSFYHDIGGYSIDFLARDGEFAAAGPSVQAVARYIHSQGPSDVVELGDLSYNTNASTLLDINIGQHYNAFIYPYPSPLFVDPDGVYASQNLDGAAATEGRTQWPYNLYNYPFGFPDSGDGSGAGGAKDRNRFWFNFGNHDYSSFLGDTDPNVNYLLEEEVDLAIPGGSPLGPDVYQAKAVKDAGGDVSAQRFGNTLQQLLDYFPWLSEDLERQLRYLGVDAAALDDVSINVGRLDPTGVDGAYYSVTLGKDESGQPLVHIQFIDSTRLLSNAGYYKFFPSSPSEQPVLPDSPDYSYNPADPSSASRFNRQNPFQGQQMLAWSKQDLAASKARWQVISPHHTTYGPAATFDNLTTKQYNTNPVLISYLSALNQSVQGIDADKGVDFVINGDSHYYNRVLEQQLAPGGIGLGIPVITLGNGGIRPASINLVPYGTPVDEPANLANYRPDRNGQGKLQPDAPGLGMPATRPVSVGASGYYSYTRSNVAPQGVKSSEERVFAGKKYTFNLPVYNYGATAQDSQFQGDTGTDVSGLYGYGQGAAIAEVDPDYFLIRYQTVEVLDPAIVALAPAGAATGRGSSFYDDWSPASAKLDDLAIFSFDIDASGRVSAVALAQAGRGYFSSAAGSADVLYSIPGNNPASPGGSQAKVRLVFEAGSLQSVNLVDGGSGYSLVANAITQRNSQIDPAAPEGSTTSDVSGLLIGLNIELEEQYTLAAKAPDDQPLYSDWYLQAVTEASVQSSAATAASPYGSFDVLVQPRSLRARELLAGAIPVTTGYSGAGQQQAFSRPQTGSVMLLDRNGQQISSPSAGQLRNGIAEFVLADLPAPGPLSAMFDGDPLSSYLVNFRPSTTDVMLDLGRWDCDVSVVGDDQLRTLAFGDGQFVTAIRSDAGSGGLDLSLVRVDDRPSSVAESATRLLQDAFGSAANALTTQRVFRSGESGWLGTEGAAMGGGSSGSAFITPGSWRPVARRDGSELALRDLKVVGNAIQADFESGAQALLTVSGSGIADPLTGLSLTVRRLGANSNGLAFYEADPVTGALLAGPETGRLPGQTGYAAAALEQAQQSGLVLRAADLPGFGQQKVLADVPLRADRNYGLLLLANDDPGSLVSSYDTAPGGAGQFVAFAAEGRGISYGIEDVLVSSGRSDRDFNDLVVTLTLNAPVVMA